ncbi:unnamed protein product [Bursaphelenchus okinawaensis]|uniref:Uncharacterized protein n=1 Tax=Bursaphelenchus okinawaensis TaxID=465554 RepID=A0A811JUX4_9BILA|nr:unnamed protein product [Bursaphelenchus okinawaensis]CAG9084205.1 unnamed protein product [Bursaphelenchus okinawaensis]
MHRSGSKGNKRDGKKDRDSDDTSTKSVKSSKEPRRRKNKSSVDGAKSETTSKLERRRKPKAKGSTVASSPNQGDPFVRALAQFCHQTVKLSPKHMAKEFTETRQRMPKTLPKTAFLANPQKNRYKDVYCLDEHRVKLTWPADDHNDYIHANYIPVDGSVRYICTQGPTEKTVNDFWRMMWQEKCKGILMLTEVMEHNKKKCEQYWPLNEGDEEEYGQVRVKATKLLELEENLLLTHLDVSADGGNLQVQHILWKNWPDRGVPKEYSSCLHMIKMITPIIPIVVHCSAGIGRTGTIVGLEMLICRLKKGEVCTITEIVAEMRQFRHGSVQTAEQFLYMHRVIMELAVAKHAYPKEDLKAFFDEYDLVVNPHG